MRLLTCKNPYAQLIADGYKSYENRSRNTKYRGPVLISSSKEPYSDRLVRRISGIENYMKMRDLIPGFGHDKQFTEMKNGFAICTAEIVDCVPAMVTNTHLAFVESENPDGWMWVLKNVRKIEPFQIKGSVSLVNLTETELQQIKYL